MIPWAMPEGITTTIELDRSLAGILTAKGWRKASSRSMRKAGISGQRAMRAEAIRRIRAAKALKAKVVRKALSTSRVSTSIVNRMEWIVSLDGKAVPLIEYRARQTKKGVTVAVNKGKRTLLRGGFITVMKSGKKGVFVRRGRSRLPIDEQLGSRPVDALLHDGEAEAVAERGGTVARAAFVRLLPVEVERVNKS